MNKINDEKQNNGHPTTSTSTSHYARNAFDQGLSFGAIIRQRSFGNSINDNHNHNNENINHHQDDDNKLRQI